MYCLQYMIDFKYAYIICMCVHIYTYSVKEMVGKGGNDMEKRGFSLNEMIMDRKTH